MKRKRQGMGMTAYKDKLFISFKASQEPRSSIGEAGDLADLMANPNYLRHSSSIINEALKEGFDVLQMPNGDIVTTGTKIITNTYVWDAKRGTLGKARASANKPARTRKTKTDSAAE
jgi:hypothetical protein